jgi:hypothetical protein
VGAAVAPGGTLNHSLNVCGAPPNRCDKVILEIVISDSFLTVTSTQLRAAGAAGSIDSPLCMEKAISARVTLSSPERGMTSYSRS